jgi:type IV pilus assembly protein PilP
LERWPVSQLKLTAVLAGIEEPVAIVENPEGKGLRAKKGMKIGINGGEIVEVLPDKVLIIESETDFTGERKTRTFEMRLRELGAREQQ